MANRVVMFDVKTTPWGSGKRVGTLHTSGGDGSIFSWSWIGISGGNKSGMGMWLWDTNTNSYHADLTVGPDPGSTDFFGELSDSWTTPQQGNAPAMPWDRTAHHNGELVIIDQNGARTTYEWMMI
jgi:hypothetical protein